MRACLLLMLVFLASPLFAVDRQWRWDKAENDTVNGWQKLDGKAEVLIAGGEFSAKLFGKGSDKDPEISQGNDKERKNYGEGNHPRV